MAKQVKAPSRPKLLKDLDKLPKDVQAAIKAEYPNGFSHKLVSYTTPKGEKVMALPFDTEELSYLVRVTIMDSKNTVRDEDDDVDEKPARENLDLDGLDLDALEKEDDSFGKDDDDDDEYVSSSRRRRNSDDEGGGDEDY